jgi:hypothetical protein
VNEHRSTKSSARYLKASATRRVVSDPIPRYFGGRVEERAPVPHRFELNGSAAHRRKSLILHQQQKKMSESGAASMAEAGELNPPRHRTIVDLLERLGLSF